MGKQKVVTRCTEIDCPKKQSCVRYTEESGKERQFFCVSPLKNGDCRFYAPEFAYKIKE